MPDGLPLAQRRAAYVTLAIAIAMAVLDGTIANTALPTIARELRASPAESIWIVNGFQLAVAASTLVFAALGQLHGPARIYRAGLVAFVAGSLACALAQTLPLLIAARVFQGLGASAIMAISPALVRAVFPRAQLGRAFGLNAMVVATSLAAGPTIGGLILAVLPWPWLFALNVPLGLVCIALNRALPHDERTGGRLDVASVLSSAVGLGLLFWGLDGFSRHDPGWTIALRLAGGAASTAWFVRRQFTLEQPMIALDVFRIPRFAFAAATSFATFSAQGLAFVALPFFFQVSLGRTPLESGLLLTPWPLAVALVAPLAGRLADRFPVGIIATTGLAGLTLGLGLYAALRPHPSAVEIVLRGLVCGFGWGFFQSPNNRELMGSVPREKSPSAGGLLAAIRTSGQTAGAAIVAIVFGVFGGAATGGQDAIAHGVPLVLWLACGCAGIATIASGLRLRSAGATS